MLVKVAVPEMAVGELTYSTESPIPEGARVIVEVQRTLHAGFAAGEAESVQGLAIKPVAGVIDEKLMTDYDLWDLAKWGAEVTMCGLSRALRAIFPRTFCTGEKVEAPPPLE